MRVPALVVLALVASSCIPFGDAWFMFGGTVQEDDGTPIQGATLQIFVNGKVAGSRSTETSDADGRYRFFEGACPCDFAFELVVTKPGYERFVYRARGRGAYGLTKLDVVLRRSG